MNLSKERTAISQNAVQKVRLLDKKLSIWGYKLIHRKGDCYRTLPFFKKEYYEDDIYISDLVEACTKTGLIEMGYIIEDGEVYCTPCVIVFYTDGTKNERHFQTFEEAERYYRELVKKLILVEF